MSVPSLKLLGSTPAALSATLTTNIYNPASGILGLIRQIHVVNKTSGAVTFSLWVGATGGNSAGTELFNGYSVAANSTYDWYGLLRLDNAQFLVGGASAGTSLTITIMGEEYLVQS